MWEMLFASRERVLPGNIKPKWEKLIPGSDVRKVADNIRLTAKLMSDISSRLDDPKPEDVYALFNGLSLDRTYRNEKTKDTPYFAKRAHDDKAWEYEDWGLEVDGSAIQRRAKGWIGSGPEPDDWRVTPHNKKGPEALNLKRAGPADRPALSNFSRKKAQRRKQDIEGYMRRDRDGYFRNERVQKEYRELLGALDGTST